MTTVTAFSMELADEFTTDDTSFVEITGSGVDKPTITDGKCLMVVNCTLKNSGNYRLYVRIDDNTTVVNYLKSEYPDGDYTTLSGGDTSDTDGQTYTLNTKADSGTTTVSNTASDMQTSISGLGVG